MTAMMMLRNCHYEEISVIIISGFFNHWNEKYEFNDILSGQLMAGINHYFKNLSIRHKTLKL